MSSLYRQIRRNMLDKIDLNIEEAERLINVPAENVGTDPNVVKLLAELIEAVKGLKELAEGG